MLFREAAREMQRCSLWIEESKLLVAAGEQAEVLRIAVVLRLGSMITTAVEVLAQEALVARRTMQLLAEYPKFLKQTLPYDLLLFLSMIKKILDVEVLICNMIQANLASEVDEDLGLRAVALQA